MVCCKNENQTSSLTQYPVVAHMQTQEHEKKIGVLSDPQGSLKTQAETWEPLDSSIHLAIILFLPPCPPKT